MKEYFHDIGNPAGLSSINMLEIAFRKSRIDVESCLKTEDVHTLFKKTKKDFKRRRFMVRKQEYIVYDNILNR